MGLWWCQNDVSVGFQLQDCCPKTIPCQGCLKCRLVPSCSLQNSIEPLSCILAFSEVPKRCGITVGLHFILHRSIQFSSFVIQRSRYWLIQLRSNCAYFILRVWKHQSRLHNEAFELSNESFCMLARLNKPAVLWALRVVLGYLGRVQSMIGTDSSRDDFRTSSPVYASGLYCWESTHHGYHFSSRVQRPVDLFSGAYCSLVEGPHFPLCYVVYSCWLASFLFACSHSGSMAQVPHALVINSDTEH